MFSSLVILNNLAVSVISNLFDSLMIVYMFLLPNFSSSYFLIEGPVKHLWYLGKRLKAVNCFRKTLYLGCVTGFWIGLFIKFSHLLTQERPIKRISKKGEIGGEGKRSWVFFACMKNKPPADSKNIFHFWSIMSLSIFVKRFLIKMTV